MIGAATMRLHLGLLIVLTAVACGDDLPEDPPQDDAGESCNPSVVDFVCSTSSSGTSTGPASTDDGTPMTSGSTDGGSSSGTSGPSTVGVPDECALSADCPDGGFCVAPFIPEFGPQGKQPSECVAECVVLMDELRWCFDAVACCDPDAVCTDRGYCELPEDSTGDDSSGGATSGGSDSSG